MIRYFWERGIVGKIYKKIAAVIVDTAPGRYITIYAESN